MAVAVEVAHRERAAEAVARRPRLAGRKQRELAEARPADARKDVDHADAPGRGRAVAPARLADRELVLRGVVEVAGREGEAEVALRRFRAEGALDGERERPSAAAELHLHLPALDRGAVVV